MALSIIPMIQPLYNIHAAYSNIYARHDRRVYADMLNMDRNSDGQEAPAAEVVQLTNTILDNTMDLYNMRISIAKRAAGEKSYATFYFVLWLILSSVAYLGLVYVYIQRLKNLSGGPDAAGLTKLSQLGVEGIAISVLYALGVYISYLMWTRSNTVTQVVHNADMSRFNIRPALKRVLHDVVLDVPVLPVESDTKRIKYALTANEREDEAFVEMQSLLNKDKNSVAYDILMRSLELRLPKLAPSSSDVNETTAFVSTTSPLIPPRTIFPPFDRSDWTPDMMKRDIEALDLIGQAKRLSDAVSYFQDLLAISSSTDATSLPQSQIDAIVQAVKTLLITEGVFASEFRVSRDALAAIAPAQRRFANAHECHLEAMRNPKYHASYYSSDDGNSILFDDAALSQVPLIYVHGSNNDTLFVKPVAAALHVSTLQPVRIDARFVSTPKTSATLDVNEMCKFSSALGCEGSHYVSTTGAPGDPLPYWEYLESTPIKTATLASRSMQLDTIRTPCTTIVQHNEDSLILQHKNLFLTGISKILDKYDPHGLMTWPIALQERLATDVGMENPKYAEQTRQYVLDILREVPDFVKRQRTTAILSNSTAYVSEPKLAMKLASLSQRQYVDEFFTNSYEVFATCAGLRALADLYDYQTEVIRINTRVRDACFLLILIEGFLVIAIYLLYKLPKFQQDVTGKQKEMCEVMSKDQVKHLPRTHVIADYTIWALVIAGIVVVLALMARTTTDRYTAVAEYNLDIMKRNATVMLEASDTLYTHMLDTLGGVGGVSDSAVLLSALTSADRMYSLDPVIANANLFSNTITINTEKIDMNLCRSKLIDIVESYQRCNTLLFGQNMQLPFPVFELFMYLFVVIMLIVLLVGVFIYLKPLQTLNNTRYWIQVRDDLRRGVLVDANDLGFANSKDGLIDDANHQLDLVIKFITILIIPCIVILFAMEMTRNTSQLTNSLYGSAMYRARACYK